MVAEWKPPKRGERCWLSIINQTRKSITQQGKREKWTRDVNLLEGEEMLPLQPSIKPEIIIKENEKWSQDGNLPEGEWMLAVHPSRKNGHWMETS